MATYCSITGAPVLVIHYPVVCSGGATDGPLPPVTIGPPPPQSGSDPGYAYTVYEPYAAIVPSSKEPTP